MARMTAQEMIALGLTEEEVKILSVPVSKYPKGYGATVAHVISKLDGFVEEQNKIYTAEKDKNKKGLFNENTNEETNPLGSEASADWQVLSELHVQDSGLCTDGSKG